MESWSSSWPRKAVKMKLNQMREGHDKEYYTESTCDIKSQFGEEILSSPNGRLPSGRHIVDYRIENDSIVYTEVK